MGYERGRGWPPGLCLPPRSPGPPGVGLVPVLAAPPFPLAAAGLRVHRWKGGVGPARHTALACLAAGCHCQRHPSPAAAAVAECPQAALLDTRPPPGHNGQGAPTLGWSRATVLGQLQRLPRTGNWAPTGRGMSQCSPHPPSTLPSNVTQEVCAPCSRFPLAAGADGCSSRRNHSRLLWLGRSWSCRRQNSALNLKPACSWAPGPCQLWALPCLGNAAVEDRREMPSLRDSPLHPCSTRPVEPCSRNLGRRGMGSMGLWRYHHPQICLLWPLV